MYSGSFQNLNVSAENHTGSLSNLSSGSEGNLMRGPGSDIDLNALYKSDLNRSMPNVPNTLLSVPNQYGNAINMSLSASNPNMAPLRTAPAPPTPAFLSVGQPNGLAQMQPNGLIPMPVQNGMQFGVPNIQNGVQMGLPPQQNLSIGVVPNTQNGMPMGGVPNVSNGMPMIMSNMSNGMPMGMQNPSMGVQNVQNSGFQSNFLPEITISEAPMQEIGKEPITMIINLFFISLLFVSAPTTVSSVDNTFLAANQPDNSFREASNPFGSSEQKGSLRKTDSLVSCTEPGPVNVTDTDMVRSPTTDEFMAILERNSTVLREATEKNQELKGASSANDAKKDEPDSNVKDDVEFSDIVDAKVANEDINAKDTEKSKLNSSCDY